MRPRLWLSVPVVFCAGLVTWALGVAAEAPPAAPKRLAVLFVGSHGQGCGHEVAARLVKAGFAIRGGAGLDGRPLSWDEVKRYNVVVVSGLGRANADMSLGRTRETLDTLNRYLAEGGGVLVFGQFGQQATDKPPQDAFLKPLGLTPLFDEMPADPETSVVATSWKLPFARGEAAPGSPVTEGVASIWYPVPPTRVGGQNHTVPFTVTDGWQVVAKGSKSSLTRKGGLQEDRPTGPGTFQGDVPIAAVREVGKGRIVYLGVTHEYVTGSVATTTLESVFLERGNQGAASGGYRLLENSLRWLAAPSLAAGNLGGAATDEGLLRDPNQTVFGAPFAWKEDLAFPAVEPAWPGVVGARTRYSRGKATADEWAASARAKGLAWIVFLEEFASLSAEEFGQLKADCARLSSAEFSAIPGFTIDDEVGNHYFYFGTTFPYPDRKFLSPDGKVFRSHDPGLDAARPYIPGQLSMTTLDYAYSISSFKQTCGNYLFSGDAAPFSDFFSNYDATGVVTARGGKVVEDATRDYLAMCDSGQGPLPLVIDLMDDPSVLGASGWRTVVRLPEGGGHLIGGRAEAASKIRDYFNLWHHYPDNPTKVYVTAGPEIESWAYVGPRDYEGNTRGDFVWQNYRWRLRGKVRAEAGLAEVVVYDGTEPFRRYLPRGEKTFEFVLDLAHDKQHNLALVVVDRKGRRAVGREHWDRNHRLEEFMCGDRNNQLTYGYLTRGDGTGLLLGGNQMLATTNKRVSHGVSPAGTFKNDALLGAPAFDGATGGEPQVWENVGALGTAEPAPAPTVNEGRRLLHTRDVHVGEGRREHVFADNVAVHNVWHTLWRTEPAPAYTVARRNSFFQVDPDSPLAVFLWETETALRKDLPNQGFQIAVMHAAESRLWAIRSSRGEVYGGAWEGTRVSEPRTLSVPFGRGAYAAYLDSPLGGGAVYSLTDGLEARMGLPGRGQVDFLLPAEAAPKKRGETRRVALLLVGIPRITAYTKRLATASNETVERFYHEFGLGGGPCGYTVEAEAGKVGSQRYVLDVEGREAGCFSGRLKGNLVSSLPIRVGGLRDTWTCVLYDRALGKARPVGALEGAAWATVCLGGERDLFIGHPVVADSPKVVVQVTQTGEKAWRLEVHNPTDDEIRTVVRKNPHFDLLKDRPFKDEALEVPAGASVWRDL